MPGRFRAPGFSHRSGAWSSKGASQWNADGESHGPNDSADESNPGGWDNSEAADENPASPASGQTLPSFDPNRTGEVMDTVTRRDSPD